MKKSIKRIQHPKSNPNRTALRFHSQAALIFLIGFILAVPWPTVKAQEASGVRPIDIMIVIDNSCSMFPRNQILPGCTSWGSDPNFLRTKGADLFIARIGFDSPNEEEFQVGVVDLGDEPELVSPLQPVQDVRDQLAGKIARPVAKSATRVVPALELAYQELRESPNHKDTNSPAVLLITDGVPWPQEGQSNQDIERLIQENQDIPLFILLLQGAEQKNEDYQQYVNFWQKMQTQYQHVYSYTIANANEIEKTYNQIIAQLNNTIPAKGATVSPGVPLRVHVGKYVQKLIITAIHPSSQSTSIVTIEDPRGQVIAINEPGVNHFRGEFNPVEVFSISSPRLLENFWTIKSDESVVVFVDREGSYRFNFIEPEADPTDLANVYAAGERQVPDRELVLRFNLVMDDGSPVVETQPIYGDVIFPDGTQDVIGIPGYLEPDYLGVYELRYDFANAYPEIMETPGRFTFVLNAGISESQSEERLPIASARLTVDVWRGPFIASIQPDEITCRPGEASQVVVTLGNYEEIAAGTLQGKIFSDSGEVALESTAPGVLSADTSALCAPVLQASACSTRPTTRLHFEINAQHVDGFEIPHLQDERTVEVIAPECTPTPPSEATLALPAVTLAPTPIPDTDLDGINDIEDRCPDQQGWGLFNGCPPSRAIKMLTGLFGFGTFVFLLLFVWPWVRVRTVEKPVEAYIMALEPGRVLLDPIPVHEIWKRRRTSRIKIGGDPKKADIVIKGLKPVEFIVMYQNEKLVLANAKTSAPRGTFRVLSPDEVETSNPKITLIIGMNLHYIRQKVQEIFTGRRS